MREVARFQDLGSGVSQVSSKFHRQVGGGAEKGAAGSGRRVVGGWIECLKCSQKEGLVPAQQDGERENAASKARHNKAPGNGHPAN